MHVISGSYPQKVLWQQVTWGLLWLRSAAGPPILTDSLPGRSCDLEYDAPETRYYFVNMLKKKQATQLYANSLMSDC